MVITGEANALLFALNRPFVPASQTPATGQWNWVGLPQAILINGKGFYGDCDLIGGLSVGAGVAEADPSCNVTTAVISPGRSTQDLLHHSVAPDLRLATLQWHQAKDADQCSSS